MIKVTKEMALSRYQRKCYQGNERKCQDIKVSVNGRIKVIKELGRIEVIKDQENYRIKVSKKMAEFR